MVSVDIQLSNSLEQTNQNLKTTKVEETTKDLWTTLLIKWKKKSKTEKLKLAIPKNYDLFTKYNLNQSFNLTYLSAKLLKESCLA